MPKPTRRKEHRLAKSLRAELRHLGRNIRDRRRSMGISGVKFADLVGVPSNTISNVEAARNWPSVPLYLAICRVLKCQQPPLLSSTPAATLVLEEEEA